MGDLSNISLREHLAELAAFKANGSPFVSLYLNAQADQHGRDNFAPFVRKEFNKRVKDFEEDSQEHKSFIQDSGRIARYLEKDLTASSNGVAIFACAGADGYFKAIELDAPIQSNELHISDRPHLYPLARVADQYPRYAALIADTDAARLFVFDLGKIDGRSELDNTGNDLAQDGVRSPLRYERRVEEYNSLHAKEAVEMLRRVVRDESIRHIILAGDDVIVPLLRKHLPTELADMVVDVLPLDIRMPEHEILKATLGSMQMDNIQSDAEKVRDLLDKYRSGGAAVVGLRDTLTALSRGQVDELLLSASPNEISVDEGILNDAVSVSKMGPIEPGSAAAGMLVTEAVQTGAAITFVEDPAILAGIGGVGAVLRYQA